MSASFRLAFVFLPLVFISCAGHNGFRVISKDSNYMLQSPNSAETPFPDLLRSYNGFISGKGSIDLRPLMELRVENAYYQKGFSREGLAGYLGTEVARYQVGRKGLKLESVEPLKNRPVQDLGVQNLVSGAMIHARCYRLYLEVFNKTQNTHVSVLLGAKSEKELDELANQLDHPETLCGAGSSHCAAFPAACSVSVEMKIVVNGKPATAVWTSLLSSIVGQHPQEVTLKRFYRRSLRPVEIDVNDSGALRLPLLPGDEITWTSQ